MAPPGLESVVEARRKTRPWCQELAPTGEGSTRTKLSTRAALARRSFDKGLSSIHGTSCGARPGTGQALPVCRSAQGQTK